MTTISPVFWFNYIVCNFTMDFFKNVYTFLPENVDHSSTRFVVHRISQSFYFSVIFTNTKQLYLVANSISIVATSPISTTRVIRLVTRNSLLVSRHSNTELHKNHSVSIYYNGSSKIKQFILRAFTAIRFCKLILINVCIHLYEQKEYNKTLF